MTGRWVHGREEFFKALLARYSIQRRSPTEEAPIDTDRRDFLKKSLLAGSATYLSLHAPWAFAAGGAEKKSWIVYGQETNFVRLDVMTGQAIQIATPTKAHSLIALPGEPNMILGLEKWGRHLSLVDFNKSMLVKSIEPDVHRNFYGHIISSLDGKHLISPQMDLQTSEGYLVWYDRETLRKVDEALLCKGGSHDLSFLPGTSILVITSSGMIPEYDHPERGPKERVGPSVMTFFDVDKKKTVKSWELPTPGALPGHLRIGSDGEVYFVTSIYDSYKGKDKPVAGGIYQTSLEKPIIRWKIPEVLSDTFRGELLSIELNEKINRLVISNPGSKQLLTFDIKAKSLIGTTPTGATGLAWDREKNILYGFEPDNREPRTEKLNQFVFQHLKTQTMSAHMLRVESV